MFKTLKLIFILALTFQIGGTLALALMPRAGLAAFDMTPVQFQPQVQIPNSSFSQNSVSAGTFNQQTGTMSSTLLAKYIQAFYNYGLAVAGILAAIVLMAGGVLWLTSAGNDSKVSQAKELITGSIVGTIILFSSWLILNTINPATLQLEPINLNVVKTITYCCDSAKGNVLMDSQGNCPTNSKMCTSGQQCTNTGNNNFGCIDTNSSFCCQYQYNDGDYTNVDCEPKSVSTVVAQNKGCDVSKSINGSTYNFSTSYNQYCSAELFKKNSNDSGDSSYNDTCITSLCSNAKTGDGCAVNVTGGCYCYNNIPWFGDGKETEPCGNEGGKCFKQQIDNSNCPSNYNRDFGGRNCGTGLYCCKPN